MLSEESAARCLRAIVYGGAPELLLLLLLLIPVSSAVEVLWRVCVCVCVQYS